MSLSKTLTIKSGVQIWDNTVIEDNKYTSTTIAINYGLSIDAKIILIPSKKEEEIYLIDELLQKWKEDKSNPLTSALEELIPKAKRIV